MKTITLTCTIALLVLTAAICAPAQEGGAGAGGRAVATPTRFRGVINDFTPATSMKPAPPIKPPGPWEVRGNWSLVLTGQDKADFSAALTMERSDLGVVQNGGNDLNNPMDRMAHTHHITLTGGQVTVIPGGIQVTGEATVPRMEAFPHPSGQLSPC